MKHSILQKGFSLVEVIVFIVVVSVALVALIRVYSATLIGNKSINPVVRVRALELAQAQMDEILSRKFDENTPTGGIPACDSADGIACSGINPDSDFDDVGDYNGNPTITDTYHTVSVSVTADGADLGIPDSQARRISVTVTVFDNDSVTLTAYKTNF